MYKKETSYLVCIAILKDNCAYVTKIILVHSWSNACSNFKHEYTERVTFSLCFAIKYPTVHFVQIPKGKYISRS